MMKTNLWLLIQKQQDFLIENWSDRSCKTCVESGIIAPFNRDSWNFVNIDFHRIDFLLKFIFKRIFFFLDNPLSFLWRYFNKIGPLNMYGRNSIEQNGASVWRFLTFYLNHNLLDHLIIYLLFLDIFSRRPQFLDRVEHSISSGQFRHSKSRHSGSEVHCCQCGTL